MLLPNGKVLMGVNFVQFNGVAHGRVAHLLPGGALDTNYAAGTGNTVVTHQSPPDSSKGPSHALRRAFFD